MNQLSIFEAPKQLSGREIALAEFKKKHPFLCHILRVEDGKAWHINTLYKDYNDAHYPKSDCESRIRKYTVCNTVEELKYLIANPDVKTNQHQYIITNVEWETLSKLNEIIND